MPERYRAELASAVPKDCVRARTVEGRILLNGAGTEGGEKDSAAARPYRPLVNGGNGGAVIPRCARDDTADSGVYQMQLPAAQRPQSESPLFGPCALRHFAPFGSRRR